jgi:hypothetical protein
MPNKLQILGLPLVLAILLLAASTAHAAPVALSSAPSSLEEEFEAELGEFEEGEGEEEGEEELAEGTCEEAEEEFEEGELSKAEVKEICDEEAAQNSNKATSARSAASAECILRTAHGHSAVGANGRKLKLTIGYTTYEPVGVTIEVGVGSSHIATLHRHLGRSGVLRKVERLRGHDAPGRLAVDIEIQPAQKAGCPPRRLVLFPR